MDEYFEFVASLRRTLRSIKYAAFTAPCGQECGNCGAVDPLLEFLRKRGLEPRLAYSADRGHLEEVYYLYSGGVPVAKVVVEVAKTRDSGSVKASARVVEVQSFL